MKRLNLIVIFAIILLSYACEKDILEQAQRESFKDESDSTLYSVKEIDAIFADRNYQLNWEKERDAKLIFSIVAHTDSMLAIGYKPAGVGDLADIIHKLDLESLDWKNLEERLIKLIEDSEGNSRDRIITKPAKEIPAIVVKVSSLKTIEQLSKMLEIRYLEPMNDYFYLGGTQIHDGRTAGIDMLGTAGCTCETPEPYHPDDAVFQQPGVVRPWNYDYHHINEDTWAISSGAGVGVAVIDSGVSFDQENLDSESGTFNSGLSQGRLQDEFNYLPYTLQALPTLYHLPRLLEVYDPSLTAHDHCGHGTRMAGLIAAPRGLDNNSVGVAYNCNLVCFRAVHNPIINTFAEKMGVTQSLVHIASDADIQIVSMSIAQPFGANSPLIIDALNFAYNNDKMLVCAAGTAPFGINDYWNVLFPANHPTTLAITGIKNPQTYPNSLNGNDLPCKDCYYGDLVDFAVIMERYSIGNEDRTTLAVTCDGDIPAYASGSSCATATFSGMAALVWSRLNTDYGGGLVMPRNVVLNKLQESASNPLGDHPNFGHGWVDIQKALEE